MTYQTTSTVVNHLKIHGHHWRRDHAPILALHGFLGSGQDMEALASASTRSWLAPDLPHHGQTQHLDETPWPIDRTARTIAHWAAHHHAGRIDCVGYSMGGRTALTLAVEAPQTIRRLILVGATPGLREEDEQQARQANDARLAQKLEQQGMDDFLAFWRHLPIISSQRNIPQPWLDQMLVRRHQNDPLACAKSLRQMGTGRMRPLWDDLARLRCPVLLITGEHDAKFTTIAQQMCETLPNATHHIMPGVGHSCHMEDPARFLTLLESFLSEHT